MSTFVPLDSRRKSEEIAHQIRELAIGLDLQPNERLPPERELSRQFNVSRTGLREALLLLESQGFIVIKRGRHGGAFIQGMHSRPVSGAFGNMLRLGQVSIDQLLEARLGIEVMLLKFVSKNARGRWLEQLDQNLAEAEELGARSEHDQAARVALLTNLHQFHNILATATQNPVFVLAAEAIVGIISRRLAEVGHEGCVSLDSVREHREIIKALKAGRVSEAQAALEAHLKADSLRTRALLKKYQALSESENQASEAAVRPRRGSVPTG
jgi:GntR family transcriptional repressor for pyruvate dehydrogenase complex